MHDKNAIVSADVKNLYPFQYTKSIDRDHSLGNPGFLFK